MDYDSDHDQNKVLNNYGVENKVRRLDHHLLNYFSWDPHSHNVVLTDLIGLYSSAIDESD